MEPVARVPLIAGTPHDASVFRYLPVVLDICLRNIYARRRHLHRVLLLAQGQGAFERDFEFFARVFQPGREDVRPPQQVGGAQLVLCQHVVGGPVSHLAAAD